MNKIRMSLSLLSVLLLFSSYANATIINTINGVQYEWQHLFATFGQSRDNVEAQLANPDSELYGYQYASRQLTSDLLYSYAPWDDLSGLHSNTEEVQGVYNFLHDFGYYILESLSYPISRSTVDGDTIEYTSSIQVHFIHGLSDECEVSMSCRGRLTSLLNQGGPVAAHISAGFGWNPSAEPIELQYDGLYHTRSGSLLYRVLPTPIPPSLLLMASGLVIMLKFSRRKTN